MTKQRRSIPKDAATVQIPLTAPRLGEIKHGKSLDKHAGFTVSFEKEVTGAAAPRFLGFEIRPTELVETDSFVIEELGETTKISFSDRPSSRRVPNDHELTLHIDAKGKILAFEFPTKRRATGDPTKSDTDPLAALSGLDAIGLSVQIKTVDDKIYQGLIFAYALGCVVLQSLPDNAQSFNPPISPSPTPSATAAPVARNGATPPPTTPASPSPEPTNGKHSAAKAAPLSFAAAAARAKSSTTPPPQTPTTPTNGTTAGTPTPQPASPSPTPSQTSLLNPLKYDFHVLNVNYIKEVTPLPAPTGDAPSLVPVTAVSFEKIAAREAAAVRAESERAAKIGVGVSNEAQQLFDAISKTYPVEWRKDVIVIMNEVEIPPPYALESVKLVAGKKDDGDSALLSRVRKILQHVRLK
ncbi:hypothetical protein HDV00_006900 [Rhizophlyctis rosea]|nr:hypothetical protein HDV00_006900 [Rhizophlyctis rosea]